MGEHQMRQTANESPSKHTENRDIMKFLGVDPTRCWNPGKLFKKDQKPVPRPASREQVIEWWKITQKSKKIGMQKDGTVIEWFHGLISRAEAEELLEGTDVGSFLVRLSDKVWGYTISYTCEERIKPFLVDASKPKKVKFEGNADKLHKDLTALVAFHSTNPISPAGEILKSPVGQKDQDEPDYKELMSEE